MATRKGLSDAQQLVGVKRLVRNANANANALIKSTETSELVFALVGHVGSGVSTVGETLKALLKQNNYEAEILKARIEIEAYAKRTGLAIPDQKDVVRHVAALQDCGDAMRAADVGMVAVALVHAVRKERARLSKTRLVVGQPLVPDQTKRAYILDSIRHPAEIHVLRQVYGASLVTIGVVCDEEQREQRLFKKYKDAGKPNVSELMSRDADAPNQPWGQHVHDAFHMADVFLDNTAPRTIGKPPKPNPIWSVGDNLNRLLRIVRREGVVRPTQHERAMFAAWGAMMASACLSRQVGAALMDGGGNIVATGTNEVPRPGGGVYPGVKSQGADHRCARAETPFCSNTREQLENIANVISLIPESVDWSPEKRDELTRALRKSALGQALEFSRAVHAEMEAILCAARAGAGVIGTTLYVTTFPCHYCARHIVGAGINEVQFIEPYPKSRALRLHEDAITTSPEGWTPPSEGGEKVLIRPFTGVAPRLYRQAFLNEVPLKDATGAMKIGAPPWGDPWHVRRVGYPELEAELARELEQAETTPISG